MKRNTYRLIAVFFLSILFLLPACSSRELTIFKHTGKKLKDTAAMTIEQDQIEILFKIDSGPQKAEIYYRIFSDDKEESEPVLLGETPISLSKKIKFKGLTQKNISSIYLEIFSSLKNYRKISKKIPLNIILRENQTIALYFDLKESKIKRIEILGGFGAATSLDKTKDTSFFYIPESGGEKPGKNSYSFRLNYLFRSLETPFVVGIHYETMSFKGQSYLYELQTYDIPFTIRKYWDIFFLGSGVYATIDGKTKAMKSTGEEYGKFGHLMGFGVGLTIETGFHLPLNDFISFELQGSLKMDFTNISHRENDSETSPKYYEGYLLRGYLLAGIGLSY